MSQVEIRAAISGGQARLPGVAGAVKKAASTNSKYDPEEQLHRNCQSWNERQVCVHPRLELIFHCPNGGRRSKSEVGRLKAMGVKAGVPDFMLPFPSGRLAGLAVELKSPVGVLSANQQRWLQQAYREGW